MCVFMCVCIVYCVHHRVNRLLVALADEPVNVAKQSGQKRSRRKQLSHAIDIWGQLTN